jgi:hypothetical protein
MLMADSQPMRIGFAGMLGWIVPVGLAIAAAGAYPTWVLGGAGALWAQLAGGLIALGVLAVGALVVIRAARRGAAAAAIAFIVAGLGMGVLLLLIGAGAWALLELHMVSLVLWIAIFFVAMHLAQSFWLYRALRGSTFKTRPMVISEASGN